MSVAKGEQFVPQWDRRITSGPRAGEIERAKLDVAFVDAAGSRTYVDVVVASASSDSAPVVAGRAVEDGRAAASAVDRKRSRYPAAQLPDSPLVPFAVEALGRLSEPAEALLQSLAPKDSTRSPVLGAAYQTLSVLVQTRLVELLRAAE